ISSRFYTAPVRGLCKLLCRKIHDKFSGLPDHSVGIALRTHGNIKHRRICTDGACPGHRQYICTACLVSGAHHHRRKRIQHIPRLPHLSSHSILSFLSCHLLLLHCAHKRRDQLLLPGYHAFQNDPVCILPEIKGLQHLFLCPGSTAQKLCGLFQDICQHEEDHLQIVV